MLLRHGSGKTAVLVERMIQKIIKDKIDLVSTIKPYTSKFITKGICAETDTTIKNIETLNRTIMQLKIKRDMH